MMNDEWQQRNDNKLNGNWMETEWKKKNKWSNDNHFWYQTHHTSKKPPQVFEKKNFFFFLTTTQQTILYTKKKKKRKTLIRDRSTPGPHNTNNQRQLSNFLVLNHLTQTPKPKPSHWPPPTHQVTVSFQQAVFFSLTLIIDRETVNYSWFESRLDDEGMRETDWG